jgi:hypothetical protein
MKKVIIAMVLGSMLLFTLNANARGGWKGGGHYRAIVPFVAGAAAGAVIVGGYRVVRPYYAPYYYPPQPYYSSLPANTAAYCPENGLYYPETEVCPSGWKAVPH